MEKIKQHPYLQLLKRLLPWIAFFALLFLALKTAHAQSYLGEEWDSYIQNVQGYAPSGQSGEDLAINFIQNAIRIVRNVIGVIALTMGVLYGFKLVVGRGQEDVITKQKTNFLYAALGFGILIIAENVANIFNPEHANTQQLVDFGAARDQLRDIVSYLKWILGSVIVLFMTISGVQMIISSDDEETITKQKRNLTWSGIGMLIILLANNIVNAIYVIRSPNETAAGAPQNSINEIAGVIRLILVFLGPVAIGFTIYAGFLYLTAMEKEDQVEKAKRMIVAGVVAIVMIYGAYAIVNTIASANLALLNPYLV